ncbi:MAG: glycosyltransferase family 4 protein [Chloroflexota bacterium]
MPNPPHIALISMSRRGSMVHYLTELANAFASVTKTSVLAPHSVDTDYFSSSVNFFNINTGDGFKGTLFRSINPFFFIRLYQTLKSIQADVYFVASVHEWNPILGFLIKKLLRKPLFFTIHDPKHHPGAPWNIRYPDYVFRKYPDGFIVHTKQAKSHLLENGYSPARVFSGYTGTFNFFKRWEKIGVKQENLILFFGRLEPYKGLDILFEIAPHLLDSLPTWQLVIAGAGSIDGDHRQNQHERLIIDNRFIPEAEVTNLMQRAKMLVMPYTDLTYSGVILTAFTFNLPVISTEIQYLPEFIKHGQTRLLVPPNNADKLTSAIIDLARDEELRAHLSAQIPIFVEENLNWDLFVRKCLPVIDDVISLGSMP